MALAALSKKAGELQEIVVVISIFIAGLFLCSFRGKDVTLCCLLCQ